MEKCSKGEDRITAEDKKSDSASIGAFARRKYETGLYVSKHFSARTLTKYGRTQKGPD